jgi:hypothetical protein
MKKLSLIAVLMLAASPAAAQVATSNQQQQPLGPGAHTVTSPLTVIGVICMPLIAATFCNVPTGPNAGGYGSAGAAGSGGGSGAGTTGISTPSPAIPPCAEFPPANELCN